MFGALLYLWNGGGSVEPISLPELYAKARELDFTHKGKLTILQSYLDSSSTLEPAYLHGVQPDKFEYYMRQIHRMSQERQLVSGDHVKYRE